MSDKKNDDLEFPKWIMSGAAGDFASVYSSHLEPPIQFFYLAYLTCLGSAVSTKLYLNSEISPDPRMYTIILGESADDRKSTAIFKTTGFFRETLSKYQICHGVGSAEGLRDKLSSSPKLVLCFDEFKQFVSKCKIESSVLLSCVTSLFENTYYETNTKKSSVILADVHLSLLAGSTLQTYENTWDSSFTDIGFNNRLFLVPGCGIRKNAIPVKISTDDKKYLQKQLREIMKHVGSGLELTIPDDAFEKYNMWYMSIEKSIHAKRLDTYSMRIMQLLAVNDLRREIDLDIINKTIAICDWQLAVRKRHDPIDADNAIAGMEEKIRRVLSSGPKTERDLKKAVHYERVGIWIFQTALSNLCSANEIKQLKNDRIWTLS